ncbi:Pfs, NACHT and ankyrin domain protein, partial [Aureobasidium pullulans]
RIEEDITSAFKPWIRPENRVPLQQKDVDKDIKAYVHHRIRHDKNLSRWQSRSDIQQDIENKMMEKAHGMFYWAACQLDSLAQCLDPRSVRKALTMLPEDIDETYERILANIPKDHWRQAETILSFLMWSERPLRLEEVVDAIAVNLEEDPAFDPLERMPQTRDVLKVCSSLVSVREQDTSCSSEAAIGGEGLELSLAHFSVKEYLTSDRVKGPVKGVLAERTARTNIATICLTYLSHVECALTLQEIEKQFALASYCARYWTTHARNADDPNGTLLDRIMDFFEKRDTTYSTCYRLCDPDTITSSESSRHGEIASPLYYSSIEGLIQPTKTLLKNGAKVNAQGGKYMTALAAASSRGHNKVVQILLDGGADFNVQSADNASVLMIASERGHDTIVRMLLDKGVDMNARDIEEHGTALAAASRSGHNKIVQMLLDNGADIKAQAGWTGDALQGAAYRGEYTIVQMLLDRGADVNAQSGGEYGNALTAAIYDGRKKIVQLLLDRGADIEIRGRWSYVQKVTSETGRRVNVTVRIVGQSPDRILFSYADGTALVAASYRGREDIVQMLLDRGADINAKGRRYGTALQAALAEGHEKIVQMLLQYNASIDGKAFVSYLRKEAKDTVVSMLSYVTAPRAAQTDGPHSKNLLHWAAEMGCQAAVERCLTLGVDVNVRDDHGELALHYAAENGHLSIVEVLVKAGSDRNAIDVHGRTPLACAQGNGPGEGRNPHDMVTEYLQLA